MFLVVLLEKMRGVASAWWFGLGGTKCPYMAALAGERTQAGQVRLQAGLLKSGPRGRERHRAAESLVLHVVFLSAPCSELSRLRGIHQDAAKMSGHSHSESQSSSLVLLWGQRCGQKVLVSPRGCARRMSPDVLRGPSGLKPREWQ